MHNPPILAAGLARRSAALTAALLAAALFAVALAAPSAAAPDAPKSGSEKPAAAKPAMPVVPDAKQSGGEPDSVVQIANLVYAGTKSSECFADHFLIQAENDSAISTSRRFHAVKLASDDLYEFPMVILAGEGAFQLSEAERQNLKHYIERGGFLLASAGCSSDEWNRSFRNEMATIFPDKPLAVLGMDHPVFHTVYEIRELTSHHGTPQPLEGIHFGGRLGIIYSQDGLNDTTHTQGCCCCGGNEINDAIRINVNILAYALTH